MIRPHPRALRLVLLVLVPIAMVLAGGAVWLQGGATVGTDDAYVKADIAQISPQISGRVEAVLVKDYHHVKAGQPLVRLDPAPYKLALDKAEAQLDAARTMIKTERAGWAQAKSELAEAQSKAAYLASEAQRQRKLGATGFTSLAKLEKAENDAAVARDQVTVAKKRVERMLAALDGNPTLPLDQYPRVREKLAERDVAALNLKRTTIRAPISGTAVNVRLQPGDELKAASPIFVIVADTRPWVQANMKETDLTYVKVGQKATVVLDVYPHITWDAVVDRLSPATGAEFAILPPQNASGNWVKVVQRLPVRIRLLPRPNEPPLRAGMTATVTIYINRHRSLAGLFGLTASAADRR